LTFHLSSDTKKEITAENVRELLGLVDLNLVSEFAQLLLEKKAGEAIEFLNGNLQKGMDPQEFTKSIIRYLRETLILKINPQLDKLLASGYTKEQLDRVQEQAKQYDQQTLAATVENFMEAEQQMKTASIIQLPLELAIIDSVNI
jgi:DNA polymerase III subunit gamma/tau